MRTRVVLLLAVNGVMASAAEALVIDLTDTGTVPMSAVQLSAFEAAAGLWENAFSDPITIKVNIEFADLDPNILGSTLSQRTTHPFSTVRSAMFADTFATNEKNAVNMLPTGSVPIQDINGTRSDSMVTMSTANAKALGLGTGLDPVYGGPLPGGADGRIQFANGFASTFDYDRSDGISASLTDFIGVAAHEIGHLLGFSSVTDVQDNNSGFTLHPSTLDLWRFNQSGGAHTLGSETRRVTHGPAEYYDSILNNRQMSRGVHAAEPVDPSCGTFSGKCQASHWRDNLENLMDPTIGPGVQVNLQSDDRQALDYIGYNRSLLLFPYNPKRFIVAWFPWDPDPGPIIPDFGGAFDEFADPPDLRDVKPPFEPDFAMRLGMDLGVEGLEKRGGLGVVQFASEHRNQFPVIEGIPADKGEETTEPDRERPEFLPPALLDFYFESDDELGPSFTGRGLFSESGAEFDPSLGEFGGYRIPLAIDGEADKKMGDTDALVTLLLLATDETGIPDPEKQNLFTLATGRDGADNGIQIFDFAALGLRPPLPGDFNGDGAVNAADYTVWRDGLGTIYSTDDYDDWKNNFGATAGQGGTLASADNVAVPEPAPLLLAVAAGIGLLLPRRCYRAHDAILPVSPLKHGG